MKLFAKQTDITDLEKIRIAKEVIANFNSMHTTMYSGAINKLLSDITNKIDKYTDDEEYALYQDVQNLSVLRLQVLGLWAHNPETQPSRSALLELIGMMKTSLYEAIEVYRD